MEQDNNDSDSAEDKGKDDEAEYPVIPCQEEPVQLNNEELNGGGGKDNENHLIVTLCKQVLYELYLLSSLCTELLRLF